MVVKVTKWGNGSGISFTKEFLQLAGITMGDLLKAEVVNGQIILTPQFHHRSLKERTAAYTGQLNLSEELPIEEPSGTEVW